jgi:hypothetical protein
MRESKKVRIHVTVNVCTVFRFLYVHTHRSMYGFFDNIQSHCRLSFITYTPVLNIDIFVCSLKHLLHLIHFGGLYSKSIKLYLSGICNTGLLHNCNNFRPSAFVFSRAKSCNVPYHCIILSLSFLFKFSTARNHAGLKQFPPQ